MGPLKQVVNNVNLQELKVKIQQWIIQPAVNSLAGSLFIFSQVYAKLTVRHQHLSDGNESGIDLLITLGKKANCLFSKMLNY